MSDLTGPADDQSADALAAQAPDNGPDDSQSPIDDQDLHLDVQLPLHQDVEPSAIDQEASSQAADPDAPAISITPNSVIVRYGALAQIGEFSHDLPDPPLPGRKVVIRSERGVELGEVLATVSEQPSWRCITSDKLSRYVGANGPEYPYQRGGKILRLANPQDVIDFRHLETSAREEGSFCRQQIRQARLNMRLVTVEHLLGGERIVFYFSAESRVDFRELVRGLAAQFRTRIEMRQVGARDEARLVGDYERCGQRCCCQQYLKDLRPVSMRMAKTQKATLDPSKISGRCGRLMCCLRYEDTVYEELRKRLPRKNIWVRTEKLVGKVIDTQIITQLVRLYLPDNTQVVVALEDIIERDVPQPELPKPRIAPPPVERPERRMLRDEGGDKADATAPQAGAPATFGPAGRVAGEPSASEPNADARPGRQETGRSEDAQPPVDAQGPSNGGPERQGVRAAGPAGAGRDGDVRSRRRRGRRRGNGGNGGSGQQPAGNAGGNAGGHGENSGNATSSGQNAGTGPAANAAGAAGGPASGAQGGNQDRRNRPRRRHRGGRREGGSGGGPGSGQPPAPPAPSA